MIIFSTFCFSSGEITNIHLCLCFVWPRHATSSGQWVTILICFFWDEIQFSFVAALLFMYLEYTLQLKCTDHSPQTVCSRILVRCSIVHCLSLPAGVTCDAGLMKHCNYNIIFPFTGLTRPWLWCLCNPDPAFYLSILMARPVSRMTLQFRPPPPTLDLAGSQRQPLPPSNRLLSFQTTTGTW